MAAMVDFPLPVRPRMSRWKGGASEVTFFCPLLQLLQKLLYV